MTIQIDKEVLLIFLCIAILWQLNPVYVRVMLFLKRNYPKAYQIAYAFTLLLITVLWANIFFKLFF